MDANKSPSNIRLTVKEAAKRLNTSEAAIRQRIQRDSIAHEKDEDTGRVFVILREDDLVDEPLNEDETTYETSYERELIDTLREQLAAEREANRENRRIIAALASRIPEIEAPSEPRGSSVTVSEESPGTQPPEHQEPTQRRSWWRAFFGLD